MGSVSSDPSAEQRTTTKSQPLALEVPVVATAARPGDQSQKRELFTEETETVLVLEHGAVIHLEAAVAVGQLVFLTNKQTGNEIVTQVLRKRSYRPTACYVELDFTEPAPGFWGVEFPKIEADAKPSLPEGGEAAEVAEAEITEEEFGPATPPPDQAEVARLRREVEALKSQLKSLATPAEQQTAKHLSDMQQPSASELENLKSLLGSKKPAEEPVEEEAKTGRDGAKNASAKLEIMSPHEPKPEPVDSEAAGQEEGKPAPDGETEKSSSYPIRMQLPKAQGTSNRSSEFAADSAAITAAIEDHLLPKPSLDFERFPGVAQPKTKLFSGKATRSLSGPIGVLVAAVLLLVAAGTAAYQLGWMPKFGGKSSKSAADKSAFPPPAAVDSSHAQMDPPRDSNPTNADPTILPRPQMAPNNARVGTPASSGTSLPITATTAENSFGESATGKSAVRSLPDKGNVKPVVRSKETAGEPFAGVNKGEDAVVPPKLIKGGRSLSPPEALRGYVSGNVVMDALVDETGHVKSATVISGRKALQQRALDTVKEYLYQPATKNGKPVLAHVEVKIQFWYEP